MATTSPCRLPEKRVRVVSRDFIPSTTTPSTRPCRKRVNRLPDVAAVIRVADGYAVGEDRPSKRFLGCENVSYGQKKSIPLNGFYIEPVSSRQASLKQSLKREIPDYLRAPPPLTSARRRRCPRTVRRKSVFLVHPRRTPRPWARCPRGACSTPSRLVLILRFLRLNRTCPGRRHRH